jgi:hypothetical protein
MNLNESISQYQHNKTSCVLSEVYSAFMKQAEGCHRISVVSCHNDCHMIAITRNVFNPLACEGDL